MPAFLLPIIANLAPYVLGAIALIGAWFGFKHKVAKEEREKLRAETEKAVEAVKRKVEVAIAKDKKIDETVRGKVDEVKKSSTVDETADQFKPGDIFKF